ncbi:hypothetical protein K8T06_02555, partial [bacterium]|nr:hypothetical protein [bacterium]
MKNLNVLFLWHMHQPSYNVDDEQFFLPWTRLHGTKDYLGMADIVSKSETFRMTFNFTPVLWEQILSYSAGTLDRELELTLKSPASLTLNERQYLLKKMFAGNPVSLIDPYPRYAELYDQFGRGGEDAAHRLTQRDITDLVVWRILAWIYPARRNSDEFLSHLMQKRTGFSEDEKIQLIENSRKILESIPEIYRDLKNKEQICLTTTPYYHPILPILINSESARQSHPGISLPSQFTFPDDAQWHVSAAIEKHRSIFGEVPEGMWPAEGSVSKAAAELFAEHKICWIASDEAILARSFDETFHRNQDGFVSRPDLLYQPWKIKTEKGPINIFFRDHYLSDLIGFDYQSLPKNNAVSDFMKHLSAIRNKTQNLPFDPCVAIILDGENAWEHYENGGFDFLFSLYAAIESEPGMKLETISQYLANLTNEPLTLPDLKPGSWINGNFDIWIGQEEENRAWGCIRDFHDALGETLVKHCVDYEKSLKFLRKSQASDSFWWFGDDHFTAEKADFDLLFRKTLIKGYETAGLIPPSQLYSPLVSGWTDHSEVKYPKNLITPIVDGHIRSYFDWFGAGIAGTENRSSAMHSSSRRSVFDKVLFGFNIETLFLRFDPSEDFSEYFADEKLQLDVTFGAPENAGDFHIILEPCSSDSKKVEINFNNVDFLRWEIAFKRIL